jgi:protein involved in polysaccharide export with SLBB domain
MYVRAISCLFLTVGVLLTGVSASAAVHAGDQLFVTVYEHPELTGPVTVDTTDHISMPLAGLVDVHNLDAKQIAARVQSSLVAYVQRPAVSVQLKTQQFMLFIAGGPGGTLKYEPGETLVAALGDFAPRVAEIPQNDGTLKTGDLSGLERSRLDMRHVGLIRDAKTIGTFDAVQLSDTGQSGPTLQPGDTLAFADKPNAVHVLGEVARPGYAFLSTDEPLADAVSQSGGILPTAATSRIVLTRGGTTQLVALGDARFNQPAQAGDSVTIPAAPRVNVLGLVDKPGPVALRTDSSLLSALYNAGGPTQWADLGNVQVVENGARSSYNITKLVHGDMSQNPTLQDGDVVFVPEGHKIAIGGIFQSILNAAFLIR